MTFGERITFLIAREECRLIGYIDLDNLPARLEIYLDPPERAQLMADAAASTRNPVESLLDAFLFLLPSTPAVETHDRGITLERIPYRRALPS